MNREEPWEYKDSLMRELETESTTLRQLLMLCIHTSTKVSVQQKILRKPLRESESL